MNAKDAIRSSAGLSMMVLKSYLSDLEDADLMERPGEGCNHLAWQLGHLIASEVSLLEMVAPGQKVALPEGFAEAHDKDKVADNDPSHFRSKQEYMDLFDQVRSATLSALEASADADLDQPAPDRFRDFCPKLGDVWMLIATHPMMHAGQLVTVRRRLGKPVLM